MNLVIHTVDKNRVYFFFENEKEDEYNVSLYHKETELLLHREKKWRIGPNLIYYFSLPDELIKHLDICELKIEKDNLVDSKIFIFGGKIDNKDILKLRQTQDTSFYTYYEIFLEEVYKSKKININENDIVLDIGANVGIFSLYANRYNPKHIFSIEPDMNNYIKLLKNTLFEDKITQLNFALTDKCGNDIINNAEGGVTSSVGDYSKLFNNVKINNVSNVPTIDINTLIDTIPYDFINFLKLDCEGCEEMLFETITDDNIDKIEKTIIEFHSEEIKNKILNYLISKNFIIEKCFDIKGNKNCGMIYAYKNLI